jgi:hypothetical protein
MARLPHVLMVAVVALGVTAPSAAAVPDKELGATLGALWQNVIETPTLRTSSAPMAAIPASISGVSLRRSRRCSAAPRLHAP